MLQCILQKSGVNFRKIFVGASVIYTYCSCLRKMPDILLRGISLNRYDIGAV